MALRLPYLTPWALRLAACALRNCTWSLPTREKVISLTFDDGPARRVTSELLEALASYEIKATFFVLGDRLTGRDTEPLEALREAVRLGHEIGVHGFHHRPMTGLSPKKAIEELRQARQIIAETIGVTGLKFFRPPFGRLDKNLLQACRAEQLIPVNASILPGDTYFPTGWTEQPERTVSRISRELHPGAIICLHAGEDLDRGDSVFSMENPALIARLLAPVLREQGYRPALLREFF